MELLDKAMAITGVGIVLFLLLSRAAEANSIIKTLGGVFTTQTSTLMGIGTAGQSVLAPTSATANQASSNPLSSIFGGSTTSATGAGSTFYV